MQCVKLNSMSDSKPAKLVGTFIKQRRQTLGLSQRALGQMLTPAVTTQFISNLERAVTPLPLNHVATLARSLQVTEAELMALLEKEYASKLSNRLGIAVTDGSLVPGSSDQRALPVSHTDYDAIKAVYEAYRSADKKTKQSFLTVCESILGASGTLKGVANSITSE